MATKGSDPTPGTDSRTPTPRAWILPALVLALFAALGCGPRATPPAPLLPEVRLVLLVVVDQLGADTLQRIEPLLDGGIGRLLDEGVVFENARHTHAITDTAPGHATIASGRWPRHHGVVGNWWFDPTVEEWNYSAGDPYLERSPRNLLADTLGDWLRRRHPGAKVFAVSGKDRSAVLLGGFDAQAAFWFDWDDGGFASSPYYTRSDPGWMADYDSPGRVADHLGTVWEPIVPLAERPRLADVRRLDRGVFREGFPHALGPTSTVVTRSFLSDFFASPLVDEHTADFARYLAEREGLGRDGIPDLLAISFAAGDAVGHEWGPHSHELVDTFLRLDRALGRLVADLEERTGPGGLLVVLTSDHGVMPLPEAMGPEDPPIRRIGRPEITCFQRSRAVLRRVLGEGEWLSAHLVFDRDELAAAEIPYERAEGVLAGHLATCPGVARVWSRSELTRKEPPGQGFGPAFWRSFHPERSPDLFVELEPSLLDLTGEGTTHGSPHPHDARVPILVAGAGIAPRIVDEPVGTVDLAPTVARLLGLPFPDDLDGEDLTGLIAPEPPPAPRR